MVSLTARGLSKVLQKAKIKMIVRHYFWTFNVIFSLTIVILHRKFNFNSHILIIAVSKVQCVFIDKTRRSLRCLWRSSRGLWISLSCLWELRVLSILWSSGWPVKATGLICWSKKQIYYHLLTIFCNKNIITWADTWSTLVSIRPLIIRNREGSPDWPVVVVFKHANSIVEIYGIKRVVWRRRIAGWKTRFL